MILGLVLVVAGLGVLGALLQSDETPKRATTHTESATEGMNKKERSLYGAVGFADCDPLRGGALPEGAVAGIRCDASNTRFRNGELVTYGTHMTADMFRYPTKRAAADAYWSRVDRLRAPGSGATAVSEDGWCIQTSTIPNLFGCGTPDGRVTFYKKAGHVFALWTEPKGVLAIAERSDGKLSKLRTVWWDEW